MRLICKPAYERNLNSHRLTAALAVWPAGYIAGECPGHLRPKSYPEGARELLGHMENSADRRAWRRCTDELADLARLSGQKTTCPTTCCTHPCLNPSYGIFTLVAGFMPR